MELCTANPSYVLFTIGVIFTTLTNAELIGDECDWLGSGLTSGQDRGVTPIYLRCREGRLKWMYPRGALRLIFHLPNDRQDFRVCIQADTEPTTEPYLFAKDTEPYRVFEKRPRFPVRLYLEGSRGLKSLYSPDDGDERVVRCFFSKRGQAAVYVEADNDDNLRRAVALMQYEARPLPRNAPLDDCRPCTPDETALAFCTSDLVAEGEVIYTRKRPEYDTSELTIQISKLVRHTVNSDSSIAASLKRMRRRYAADERLYGRVHVASFCGATSGPGKVLVMARKKLGRLTLVCAPRIEDWSRLVEEHEHAPCKLKH